mmetsp:Transcript_34244/g.78058  ORF Transcript_34244/g.78058 Transcript_34244/m.78058 type:complete len:135 (+) Transcript_34244:26-430(+)
MAPCGQRAAPMQQGHLANIPRLERPIASILAEASICADEVRRALVEIRSSDALAAARVQDHFARALSDTSRLGVVSPQHGCEAPQTAAEEHTAPAAVPIEPLRARFWAALEHLQCSASQQQRLNEQWAPFLDKQ